MKKLFVLAVASLVATSANAAEMKWSGSAGWRYDQTSQNDSLDSKDTLGKDTSKQTTKAHRVRANLGAGGGWENVEYGMGIRTGGNTTVNSDYVTVDNGKDMAIALDQAWFRYMKDFGSLDLNVTFGRQKPVIAFDNGSQNLFDNDVRFDGLGWKFKFGMFGLNAAQYILGAKSKGTNGSASYSQTEATQGVATTKSKFNTLLAVQPHMSWKFTDEIETMFAVGYYVWSDDSNTNATGGGADATGWNAGTVTPQANGTINVHNPKQWHFLNTWSLPYNLSFVAEYLMNKKTMYTSTAVEADKSAMAFSLNYGKIKKAHDFTLGYTYVSKGLASSLNRYSYDRMSADNKGHKFVGEYALADNFSLATELDFLKEKAKKTAAGVAYTNSAQALKTNYFELTANVSF